MKYQEHRVTFAEIPDEITLCIEVAGCKLHCPGCHSPWLQEDRGEELTIDKVKELIDQNPGITCVCFMGGQPEDVEVLTKWTRKTGIKIAWYTGLTEDQIPCSNFRYLDYIKVGPYVAERGPLNQKTTNQRLFKVDINDYGIIRLEDITFRFWHSIDNLEEKLGDFEEI